MADPFDPFKRNGKPVDNTEETDEGADPFPVYESGRESLMPPEAPETNENPEPAEEPESPRKAARSSRLTEKEHPTYAQKQAERVRRAQEAWSQEARRVDAEGEAPNEAMAAWAKEDRRRQGKAPDDGPAPGDSKRGNRKKKAKSAQDETRNFLKNVVIAVICGVLFITVALMIVSCFISEESSFYPLLALPRKTVTRIMSPVQGLFSGFTDSIANYVRTLKVRGNIEYEYEKLLRQLDDYANENAQLEELRRINSSLYDQLDEQDRNRELDPVAATVIGTDSSNYFSTLTLDVGSRHGVKDYMAVVAQGGLVGVTYNVQESQCQVRCIINSNCTVAALIQSTRDQGSVKGTLGDNGEAMCRMYYLPENALTRPGDMVVTSGVGLEFPKGIPIGVVRESTRGMEENKSYVVIDPVVDFQHLEYVTVYRYRPAYAEAAQARSSAFDGMEFEVLSTPRAVPTFMVGQVSDFIFAATTPPEGGQPEETPAPPTETPAPQDTPAPESTPLPENKAYQVPDDPYATVTPSPRPTFTPAPTPGPTQDPGGMTVEDD